MFSGCIDKWPAIHKDCKNLDPSCPRLKSYCQKTLKQVVGNSNKGKKCQKRIKQGDANRKIYEFCAGSCQKCSTFVLIFTVLFTITRHLCSILVFIFKVLCETGVSLKEYQKQLDIFKKSIDAQRRDMGETEGFARQGTRYVV